MAMEVQFRNEGLSCLREVIWEVKNEEQTQEVKLPDTMPDIGKVLGSWGQVLLRGKEWRGNGMSVTGGVMGWVLYLPEGETEPRTVETWIPFQLRWDFPQTDRDGAILADVLLKTMDARSVSARKLMVRAVVSVAGCAMEPMVAELFAPDSIPEDVYLLRRTYPMLIPRESGEKTFNVDEEMQLPGNCQNPRRLLRYSMNPEITDHKIMADKVVFRGTAHVRILCKCDDGEVKSCDFELPFSQYADLEREYDPNAAAKILPAVTNLDMELQENGMLRIKAGLVGQYVIYDHKPIELVEDAYSPRRPVKLRTMQLQLPSVLEQKQENLQVEQVLEGTAGQLVDVFSVMEHPRQDRRGENVDLELPGAFHALFYDAEGNLASGNMRWTEERRMDMPQKAQLAATCRMSGLPQGDIGMDGIRMLQDMTLDTTVTTDAGVTMVTGLELGEVTPAPPDRPSLILRRAGDESLWDMAKHYGSTEDAIRKANGLVDEPVIGQILIIPVE
jgi:hypothetical protein